MRTARNGVALYPARERRSKLQGALGKPTVFAFCTRWGPLHGGINAFNAELCKALATLGADVTCVSLAAEATEVAEALREGVRLAPVGIASDEYDESMIPTVAAHVDSQGARNADLWIGHDVSSGSMAFDAQAALSTEIPCLLIHHMNFRAYKSLEAPAEVVEQKYRQQHRLFQRARLVAAVGPKLVKSAEDLLRRTDGTPPRPFEIIPGLPAPKFLTEPNQFSLFFAGRLTGKSARLKQRDLGIAAFGRAVRDYGRDLGTDPVLTLVGAANVIAQQAECQALADRHAQRRATVIARPFIESRDEMLTTLREQSAAMMLSIHEGFGLTGWESIGVGVPLIASRNSGLYEYLARDHGGAALGCLFHVDIAASHAAEGPSESDITAVAQQIANIARDPKGARRDAQKLRGELKSITWTEAARHVLQACGVALPAAPPSRARGAPAHMASDALALFDVYEAACEPSYFVRPVEPVLSLAPASHTWLFGPSGAGKSTFVRHKAMSSPRYRYICLASCVNRPLQEVMTFLAFDIAERLQVPFAEHRDRSVSDLIRAIARIVTATHVVEPILHLDEVPVSVEAEGHDFDAAVGALLTELAVAGTTANVIVSSVNRPIFNATQMRIKERLVLEQMNLWTSDDISMFIEFLMPKTGLSISMKDRESIARAAGGSPRFVKSCFRTMLRCPDWSLTRVIAQTQSELQT